MQNQDHNPLSSLASDAVDLLGIGRYWLAPGTESLAESLKSLGCPVMADPSEADVALVYVADGQTEDVLAKACASGAPTVVLRTRSVAARERSETIAFEAGLRKHPRYHEACPYSRADDVRAWTDSLLVAPSPSAARWPLSSLQEERSLHMDMMRVTGRRADAHTARYALAAEYARPGDVVLDVACGYGYGAAIIAGSSSAGRVVGVDLSDQSIAYATDNYGTGDGRVSFRAGDAQDLSFLPDASVDLVASFETIEHIPHPDRLLDEVLRVLKPGGRLVCSVPNRWVDHTGRDPNPYHLHVYDEARLRGELSSRFLIERMMGETCGGNELKLPDAPRDMFDLDGSRPTEWIVGIAMKDPVGAESVPYVESVLPYVDVPRVALDYASLFSNPWLAHAMTSVGWRARSKELLADIAARVRTAYPPGSGDALAALCVQGYALLGTADRAGELASWADEVESGLSVAPEDRPETLRWKVSLRFLKGLLLERAGRRLDALAQFDAVAALPAGDFHPTLLNKVALAHLHSARIMLADGDGEAGIDRLRATCAVAASAFDHPASECFGRIDRPHPFYMREMADTLRYGAYAARALEAWASHGLPGVRRELAVLPDAATGLDMRDFERERADLRANIAEYRRKMDRLKSLVPKPFRALAYRLLGSRR